MWTPKRILIMLGTLPLFIVGFVVYGFFLGNVDGLPPLPKTYEPVTQIDDIDPPEDIEGTTERKLKMAFGIDCEELRREIRVNVNSKKFTFSAGEMDIDKSDGRVKLFPFSAALFPSKERLDRKFPEINTVQCDIAYLTLDQAVTSPAELPNRKIVGVELQSSSGKILLTNNRATPEKSDDIELVITQDSLFFDDRRDLIWTDGFVKLLDNQTHPHPTRITAKGMELQLAKDATPRPRKDAPKKGEALQGVETLTLKANVEMHFYVDSAQGLLGGMGETKKVEPKDPKETPERAHLVVSTAGRFHYDLNRELATFDSPDGALKDAAMVQEQVVLVREHKVEGKAKYDELKCDHLELQFRRKPREGAASKGSREMDKEIETALATARAGKDVSLEMSQESLKAWAAEMHYRCPTATVGPQTTLKGSPMNAIKEGHKIQCRELHLIGADKKGIGQQAFARGPGQIDLFDKVKNAYPFHAFWKDSLISTKDRDGDKVYDLLTLTGDATFLDEEHQQELQAQRLQVWLDQAARPTVEKADTTATASRQRPHKLDAYEQVMMRSTEMMIDRCNHLIVKFDNQNVGDVTLPDTLPKAETLPPLGGDLSKSAAPATPPPVGKAPPPLGAPKIDSPAAEPGRNRNPFHLQANEIVAYMASKGAKKELMEVMCEGNVHVRQEGNGPKDKGVEIKGEILNLQRNIKGDCLEVYGDSRKTAYMQLGELILNGPKILIDQKINIARVDGPGAMRLPSNKTFDGGRPVRPGAMLTIHWNKEMIFNGKDADFAGGVVAYQDEAAMKCDTLQVTLDRVVSLKEGQKRDQQAAVEKLICHRRVYIEDQTLDPAGKLQQYNRLVAAELSVDNIDGSNVAHGPKGRVITINKGGRDALIPPKPGAAPVKAVELVHKRTVVDFDGRMFSNTKAGARNAKFYDNVEVFHDITENPNTPVNPDKPGKDGFYLRCDVLSVFGRTDAGSGKTTQEMEAIGKIFFKTEEFSGRAHIIRYDEANDVIIFEGSAGNPASLFKERGVGVDRQEIKGNKIRYNRRTGEFHLEGGRVLRWSMRGDRPLGEYQLVMAATPAWRP